MIKHEKGKGITLVDVFDALFYGPIAIFVAWGGGFGIIGLIVAGSLFRLQDDAALSVAASVFGVGGLVLAIITGVWTYRWIIEQGPGTDRL